MSRDVSQSPGLNRPRQARSEATLHRLLDATETLLDKRAAQDVSLRQIATAAGCSTGAIYKRFADKTALIEVLFDRFLGDVEEMLSAFDEASFVDVEPAVTLRLFVATLVNTIAQREGVARALFRAAERSPGHRRRAALLIGAASSALGRLVTDPRRADFAAETILAILDQRLVFGADASGQYAFDTAEVVEALTAMLSGYLDLR